MNKHKIVFSFNAPATLCFALVSLGALGLNILTAGASNRLLFSVYPSGFSPLFVLRLFLHVLGHSSFTHYLSNMAYILALGPIVEERYGSVRTLAMIAVSALVTGILLVLFGGNVMTLGASSTVYMLIFLASTSGAQRGEIPLTLVAVIILYLTQEITAGLFSADSVSHFGHIAGGLCGAFLGLFLHR